MGKKNSLPEPPLYDADLAKELPHHKVRMRPVLGPGQYLFINPKYVKDA